MTGWKLPPDCCTTSSNTNRPNSHLCCTDRFAVTWPVELRDKPDSTLLIWLVPRTDFH